MPTATYDLIATTTLAASAPEVVFGSIPNTFRDLVLVANWTAVANTTAGILRYNGDSSSIYNLVAMYGLGSGSGASFANSNQAQDLSPFPRLTRGNFTLQVMDYSATDKHKTHLIRQDVADYAVWASAGRYASTSAINSILLSSPDGSFAAGSTLALYGIRS